MEDEEEEDEDVSPSATTVPGWSCLEPKLPSAASIKSSSKMSDSLVVHS